MSHLYTECGWCRPGFTADIPPPWPGTNTKTYLTPQRPGIDGHPMSRCPHFIRLLIIKTVFCPNLKFRQLGTLPTPREPQELTASDQIRDNRDDVMKQRDAAWHRGLVTKQCHWPLVSSGGKELLLKTDLILIPFLWFDSMSSFRCRLPPKMSFYLVKRGKCVIIPRNYDGRADGKNKSLCVIGIVILAKTTLILLPASSVFLLRLLRKKVPDLGARGDKKHSFGGLINWSDHGTLLKYVGICHISLANTPDGQQKGNSERILLSK